MSKKEKNSIVFFIEKAYKDVEKKTVIIAIDGRCGAGKTTLAKEIKEKYGCNVLHMDDFFLRPEQRTKERYDTSGGNVDYERFKEEILLPLSKGLDFNYKRFDCHTFAFCEPIKMKAKKINIVEGTYSMHPELIEFYDYKIFLDISKSEQKERLISRESKINIDNFFNKWIPLEEKYFDAFHIKDKADLIISNK